MEIQTTKKRVKTSKDIRSFLKACSFEPCTSGNGCCEYLKEISGDNLYVYQINAEAITDILFVDEKVFFSENGKDPSITPMYRYSVEYPNLKAMVEEETKRGIDFSGGLEKWLIK